MNLVYEEIIEGASLVRSAPGARHEQICARLHQFVRASVADFAGARLLPVRAQVRLSADTTFRPDLSLVTAATGKLWLAAEIVSSDDHRADTVIKKQIYEELKLPRLWMIDPRYDNIEVYYGTRYGLQLKAILAGREVLTEKLLPEFQIAVDFLFQTEPVKG
jgi:Uma2 family endonuclease